VLSQERERRVGSEEVGRPPIAAPASSRTSPASARSFPFFDTGLTFDSSFMNDVSPYM